MATVAVCCLGAVAVLGLRPVIDPPRTDLGRAAHDPALATRADDERASRAFDRAPAVVPPVPPATPAVPPTPPAGSASATEAAPTPRKPKATSAPTKKPPTKKPAPRRPVVPAPVAGLTVAQMANATTIVRTGQAMGVPRRALVIAVATAMQESNLYNLASGVLPESQNHPHQGVGWDHDSVGLFQQRSSAGWGPVGKLMDPAYATRQFLSALLRVPGWQAMALTDAAQAVQVSAFPGHYAQHEGRATMVVEAVLAAGPQPVRAG